MNLIVYSEFGSNEKVNLIDISIQDITKTMNNIDWKLFHQVIIYRNNYNWIEVGGYLWEGKFSCIYFENNSEYIMEDPPTSSKELTGILISYFKDDGIFKIEYDFIDGTTQFRKKQRVTKINGNKLHPTKKKGTYLILGILGLIILRFAYGHYRANSLNDPYSYSVFIIILGIIGLIYIYKKNKNEKEKNELKYRKVEELKSNIDLYKPKIKTQNLPLTMKKYMSIFEKWGIKNRTLRENLYENSDYDELIELKSVEKIRNEMENFISMNDNQKTNEKVAIKLTLKAYNELGLWSWETKKN